MSILLIIGAHLIGIILFLFFYWRSLREDHTSQEIFSSSLIIIGAILTGSLIGSALVPVVGPTRIFSPRGLWFWGAAIGLVLGFIYTHKKYKFRLFEMIETVCIASLFWLLTLSIREAIWPISIGFALLILLFFFLKKNYRRFNWYKSGKVGFAGLASLAIFFLLRGILAIFFYDAMVSFGRSNGYSLLIGRIDALISATIAFCFILCIYTLSKSK